MSTWAASEAICCHVEPLCHYGRLEYLPYFIVEFDVKPVDFDGWNSGSEYFICMLEYDTGAVRNFGTELTGMAVFQWSLGPSCFMPNVGWFYTSVVWLTYICLKRHALEMYLYFTVIR